MSVTRSSAKQQELEEQVGKVFGFIEEWKKEQELRDEAQRKEREKEQQKQEARVEEQRQWQLKREQQLRRPTGRGAAAAVQTVFAKADGDRERRWRTPRTCGHGGSVTGGAQNYSPGAGGAAQSGPHSPT